jgi:hypothetical protein
MLAPQRIEGPMDGAAADMRTGPSSGVAGAAWDRQDAIAMLRRLAATRGRERRRLDAWTALGRLPAGDPLVDAWAGELRRFRNACGCVLGRIGALAGVVAGLGLGFWLGRGSWLLATGVGLASALVLLVLLSALGHAIGLRLAARRFGRATERLVGHLRQLSS